MLIGLCQYLLKVVEGFAVHWLSDSIGWHVPVNCCMYSSGHIHMNELFGSNGGTLLYTSVLCFWPRYGIEQEARSQSSTSDSKDAVSIFTFKMSIASM